MGLGAHGAVSLARPRRRAPPQQPRRLPACRLPAPAKRPVRREGYFYVMPQMRERQTFGELFSNFFQIIFFPNKISGLRAEAERRELRELGGRPPITPGCRGGLGISHRAPGDVQRFRGAAPQPPAAAAHPSGAAGLRLKWPAVGQPERPGSVHPGRRRPARVGVRGTDLPSLRLQAIPYLDWPSPRRLSKFLPRYGSPAQGGACGQPRSAPPCAGEGLGPCGALQTFDAFHATSRRFPL